MNKKFSKGEAIHFGWESLKKNFIFFVVVLLLISALSSISSSAQKGIPKAPLFGGLIVIASIVLSIIIQMGLTKAMLKIVDGQKPAIDDLFSQVKLFWRYLGVSILYGLIVLGGLILLIVPGVIWALKYQFARYLVIDKNMGIMESIRKSGEITKGQKGQLFLFALLTIGIIVLGALAFMIGLFVAVPIAMVGLTYVYRKLLPETPSAA